ncbi:hypothetical protein CA13_01090 [Planctomycetes bacterium CA13]|uniref:Uncharacterized protein n=1 Tax=Novipirellula herctigrandis TaxID=2527986 RepID=A0A5C5YUJ4_9BACT|nr:hypothetical protein CA13_01090 [Planctomycetes bacterium CA13]
MELPSFGSRRERDERNRGQQTGANDQFVECHARAPLYYEIVAYKNPSLLGLRRISHNSPCFAPFRGGY